MLYHTLEAASLCAWPALRNVILDGWVVRFAQGYTRRANSVTALAHTHIDIQRKIAVCEGLYQAQNLPPIFRLTHFSAPAGLDELLAQRGYMARDASLVLHCDLSGWHAPHAAKGADALCARLPLAAWLEQFARLQGGAPDGHHMHAALLQRIRSPCLPMVALDADAQVVACVLGVLTDDCCGLFDLFCAPACRRQGHATRLLLALLQVARQHGARHAYLQVVQRNTQARRLYASLGFRRAYAYWYRQPAAPNQT
jgi:GNAT superfamily N-acetyltransferase